MNPEGNYFPSPRIGPRVRDLVARSITGPAAEVADPAPDAADKRVFRRAGRESTFALQFAPAAGAVIGDDVLEHGTEGRRIDGLALADGDGAGGFVIVTSGYDPSGSGTMPPS